MQARRAAFAKIIRGGGNTPLEMSGKWWRDADLGERPERRRSGLTVRGSPAGGGRSGRSCGTASGAQLPSDCSRRRPFDKHSGNYAGDGRTRRSCDRPCQRCRHRRLGKKKLIGRVMGRMGRMKLAHRRGNPASNVLHFHMYGTSYPTFCKDRSAQADRMYDAGRATNGRWMQAIDPGHYFGADGQHHDSGNTAPPGGRMAPRCVKPSPKSVGHPPKGL